MARKSKKPGIKKLQINLTNRWLYTLIVFFSLIVIGVFVYAVAPNPGHDITQIAQPSGCDANQFLKWTGSSWTCGAVSSGLWTLTGSNIYYNTGNVGIGTTSPAYKLDVTGTGRFTGALTVATINTGNGAKEVNSIAAYLGNQNLRTTDSPTFGGATINGDLVADNNVHGECYMTAWSGWKMAACTDGYFLTGIYLLTNEMRGECCKL